MAAKKVTTEKEKPKRVRKATVKVATKPAESIEPVRQRSPKGLVPVQTLFQDSWILFKSTFFSYIKLVLIGVGLFIVIGLVGMLIGIPLMLSSSGSASTLLSEPSALQLIGIILTVVWVIASFLALYVFFIFLPIASIFVIDNDKKPLIGDLIRKSKPLILPYFITTLLMGVILLGGWTLLIIPGIVFSVLFSFVSYVVVLEKVKGQEALRRSYALVKSNFWQIVLRVFIIQICIFMGTFILDNLSEQSDIFALVSFLFSLAAGWFAQVYIYLVYKQIKSAYTVSSVSLQWVWIVAGIGLVLFSIFLYTLLTNGMELLQSPEFLQLMNADDASEFETV
jgi:hypothetical protein